MPPTNPIPDLHALGVALAIDVVAVAVLALGIYFRQRGRRDLLMASVCANVALFAVVTVLGLVGSLAGLAIGLGLFGALSIIRLRSEPLSHAEIAYFFTDRVAARWRALRAQGLVDWLVRRVDDHARALAAAQVANFRRWPILGRKVWPNPVARQTYAAEVAYLKSWLRQRTAWIDPNIDRLGS
jgi:hypothetical protein